MLRKSVICRTPFNSMPLLFENLLLIIKRMTSTELLPFYQWKLKTVCDPMQSVCVSMSQFTYLQIDSQIHSIFS